MTEEHADVPAVRDTTVTAESAMTCRDGDYVLALLRREGIDALAASCVTGCKCRGRLAIRNVEIDVHCGCSPCPLHEFAGVHVIGWSLDCLTEDDLRLIGKEVRRQVFGDDNDVPIAFVNWAGKGGRS